MSQGGEGVLCKLPQKGWQPPLCINENDIYCMWCCVPVTMATNVLHDYRFLEETRF